MSDDEDFLDKAMIMAQEHESILIYTTDCPVCHKDMMGQKVAIVKTPIAPILLDGRPKSSLMTFTHSECFEIDDEATGRVIQQFIYDELESGRCQMP